MALSRSSHFARFALVAMCVTAVAATCSSSDDDDSSAAGDVDRAAVEEFFYAESAAALDGGSLVQGATFDGCPILGEASVKDLVDSAGLDVEVESGSDHGFVSGSPDYIHYSCSADTDDGPVGITVSLTPFLDAPEWLANRARVPEDELDYEAVDEDGFASDSLVRVSADQGTWPVWVSDGLAVSPRIDGSFGDHLGLLTATVDAIAEAAGTSEDDVDGLGPDGIDRDALFEAFDDIQRPGENGFDVRLIDDACPFLSDASYEQAADELDWADADFGQATSRPGSYALDCIFGTGEERRQLSLTIGRPLSVDEYARQLDRPATETDTTIEPLDVSLPGLSGGAYTGEGPAPHVGYVDNGLRVVVSTTDGDDPEAVIGAVVPAILDELGLS